MHIDAIKELVNEIKWLFESHEISWNNNFLRWEIPNNIKADLSINILSLSYKSGKTSEDIFLIFSERIKKIECELLLIKPGYINILFSLNQYKKILFNKKYFFKKKNLEKKKISIEFISANPTGYLHLAHFRQAFFGTALANIYKEIGYDVITEYYINDKGRQIEDLLKSVYYFYQKLNKVVPKEKEIDLKYPGESSKDAAIFLKKKWNKKHAYNLNQKNKENLKSDVLTFILDKIKKDLKKCKIIFDKWTSEKNLFEKNEQNIYNLLEEWKKDKKIYLKDNGLFFKSSLFGDDKDRVLIKSNGEHTYFFNDIFFHREKLKRADTLINIWGSDHHGYIKRLVGACKILLGVDEKKIKIILQEMIHLLLENKEKTKFSKREGNAIFLKEACKYIDLDQLRFFCLEKDPNKELCINKQKLQEKQEKNLVYYIQYGYARCCQILKKNTLSFKDKKKLENNISINREERVILNEVAKQTYVLEDSAKQNRPHIIIYYLINLSQKWQFFYDKHKILNEDNSLLTLQRLLIVKLVKNIIKWGLKLLGIKAPNKMQKK